MATEGIDSGLREKILSFDTSNKEAYDLLMKEFRKENINPAELGLLQTLFTERNQNVSLMSNLVRAIADAIDRVINNIGR